MLVYNIILYFTNFNVSTFQLLILFVLQFTPNATTVATWCYSVESPKHKKLILIRVIINTVLYYFSIVFNRIHPKVIKRRIGFCGPSNTACLGLSTNNISEKSHIKQNYLKADIWMVEDQSSLQQFRSL
jgi:hypothetical protein